MAAMLIFSGVALTYVDNKGERRTATAIRAAEARDVRLIRQSFFANCERNNWFRNEHNHFTAVIRSFMRVAETRAHSAAIDPTTSEEARRVSARAQVLYRRLRLNARPIPLSPCWRQVYGHGVSEAQEQQARQSIWRIVEAELRAEERSDHRR